MPQKGVDHLFPHWKKDLEQCIPATSGFCKKSALCLMMNHSGLCKCCLNFSRQGWADWHGHPDCLKNGSITKAKWWKEWNMYMCLCLWFLISYHSLMKKKKRGWHCTDTDAKTIMCAPGCTHDTRGGLMYTKYTVSGREKLLQEKEPRQSNM